jgi:hypothetical protein
MHLQGYGLVRSWKAIGDEAEPDTDRLPDLCLLRGLEDGAYRLFFFGHGAEGGLWPPGAAEVIINEMPRIRALAGDAVEVPQP